MTTATQGEPTGTLEEPCPAFFAFCFAPPGAIIEDHQRKSAKISHVATDNLGSIHLLEVTSLADLEATTLAIQFDCAPDHLDAAHTLTVKI